MHSTSYLKNNKTRHYIGTYEMDIK